MDLDYRVVKRPSRNDDWLAPTRATGEITADQLRPGRGRGPGAVPLGDIACRLQARPMMEAVAINSSNSASDTLPETE